LIEAQKIALASKTGRLFAGGRALRGARTYRKGAQAKAHRMIVSDLGDSGDNAPQVAFQPTNAVAEEAVKVPPSGSKDEEDLPLPSGSVS